MFIKLFFFIAFFYVSGLRHLCRKMPLHRIVPVSPTLYLISNLPFPLYLTNLFFLQIKSVRAKLLRFPCIETSRTESILKKAPYSWQQLDLYFSFLRIGTKAKLVTNIDQEYFTMTDLIGTKAKLVTNIDQEYLQ